MREARVSKETSVKVCVHVCACVFDVCARSNEPVRVRAWVCALVCLCLHPFLLSPLKIDLSEVLDAFCSKFRTHTELSVSLW